MDTNPRSRGVMRPGFGKFAPRKSEGAGDPRGGRRENRVPAAPIAPCAKGRKHTAVDHRFTGTPGLPCAIVLTVYAALSPATNSSCHRRRRIEGFAAPGRARKPHGFAVRNIRRSSARRRSLTRSKTRPAISLRAQRCRVHRIPSRVRDDHDTPLCGVGRRG